MKNFFKFAENNTHWRQEFFAGITTFLTMSYIIFVHPAILAETGMDKGALITATALAAFVGSLLMGLWANVPLALAPGMGLNAFFAYSLVLGQQVTWQTALGVVFVSGILFLILTLLGVREKVVDAIPLSLRIAIPAGIGLFVTFVGLRNLGLVVEHPATLVTLGKLNLPVLLGLLGLLLVVVLEIKKIKGSILIGIIITTVLGILFGQVPLPSSIIAMPYSLAPIAFQFDLLSALHYGLWASVFSFMFVDLFDSVGTILGCAYEGNFVDENGKIKKINKMLEVDAVSTVVGAALGTSTTTTYVESASGIAAGGRTGFTAIVVAFLFLFALLFSPIISIVPAFATAPALVVVGVYMMKNISHIDFTNFREAIPAFLIIVLMPLTYSISHGLSFGFLAYVLIYVFSGKLRKISLVLWVVAILSAINLIVG